MDVTNVVNDLEVLAKACGYSLSVEQQAALSSSLLVLKANLKFANVRFVGKVLGVNGDYYLAVGTGSDMFDADTKRAFVSTDCASWVQLPVLDPLVLPFVARVQGRFSGEPSWEFVVDVPDGVTPPASLKPARGPDDAGSTMGDSEYGDDSMYDDASEMGGDAGPAGGSRARKIKYVRVSEEKRLAFLVDTLEFDTAVVPRGAFIKTPTEAVVSNPTFTGLSVPLVTSLTQYAHFRPPVALLTKSLLEREGDDPNIDFMDTLDEDVPAGAWSVNYDVASQTATLRSLLWPGAVAFHTANSRSFGFAYFGTGEKNWNLPFMIPTKAATDAAAKAAAEAKAAAAAAATGAGLLPDENANVDVDDDADYDDYA